MKVSVCIPTYNQSQYLEQSVRSAYEQSLPPFEIIVSDDCSTDDTQIVLRKLEMEIPILRIIRQNKNIGMVCNTDACLREGIGEFIVGLDSDDYLSSTYIEKLTELLITYPEACYAHANVQEIDQNGKFRQHRTLYRRSGFQSGESALRAARKGYRVTANIIMFRRSDLIKLNYFSNRPDYVKDYHFAAATASLGLGNVYLNESLAYYRVWIDKGNVRLRRKLNEIIGLYKVFEEILEPAFKKRGWSLSLLHKQRADLACYQADSLSYKVYTKKEKEELVAALNDLSPSIRVKVFAWLYLNGFGKFIEIYRNIIMRIRSIVKEGLLKLSSSNNKYIRRNIETK